MQGARKNRMCKARRSERLPWRTFACLVILASFSGSAGGSPAAERQRVLIVYSEDRLLPATLISDEAIRATLAAGSANQIELYSEFLDTARFPGEAHQQRQVAYLQGKYAERPPHLVIAGGGDALSFLLKQRGTLFMGVPIVYGAVRADELPGELPTDVVGVPLVRSASSTLETALRLQPDTRHVAVVAGSAATDRERVEELSRETPAFSSRVSFTWLTGLSMQQLHAALSSLPDHTIVFYLTMYQDAAGRRFVPRQALEEFAPASNAPIYGYYDSYLGHGIVGGSMVTFEELGRTAAEVGLRILAGQEPRTVVGSAANRETPMFDWKQLVRWKISEARLPPGRVLRFKEPTLWEAHRWAVVAAVSFVIAETLFVAALLTQLRRRRSAEESLRESEERVSLAVDSAGAGLWAMDLTTKNVWVTERAKRLLGLDADDAPDRESLFRMVHTDDRQRLEEAVSGPEPSERDSNVDFRVVHRDGTTRWIVSRGRARFGSNATPVRLTGSFLDITARKQAEEESRRHFQEMAHITRVALVGELSGTLVHELGQPLGAMLANAEAAELHLAGPIPDLEEVRAILADIRRDDIRAGEIVQGMRGLLRRHELDFKPVELRSLMEELETLAAPDAIRRHARLDFRLAPDLPPVLGHRVQLQQVVLNLILNGLEAMNDNSPARRMLSVSVDAGENSAEIAVADTGPGVPADKLDQVFTPFVTTKTTGLGMGLSICRRIVEAHGGRIWIENNHEGGATVRFTLPATVFAVS